MSERIDHAAEALRWAEQSNKYLVGLDGSPMTDAQAVTSQLAAVNGNLMALVHSQLALVEQVRIANLIALSESGRATVNGARAALETLYDGRESEGTAHMHLHPDIAAALGIGGDE